MAIGAADEAEGQHSAPFTFHIPNFFARSGTGTPSATYEALPVSEHGHERSTTSASDDIEEEEHWHRISHWHRLSVYISFGILGAAVLLPFNAIITPSEFYRTLFRGTSHETTFMSWIVVTYNVACITFGAHATASMPRRSIAKRTRLSAGIIILALLIVTLLSAWYAYPSNLSGREHIGSVAFPLAICITLVMAASTSYLQVAIVTLSNAFGPSCLGFMLAGQGFVGAIVSGVQLASAYANVATNAVDVLSVQRAEAKTAVSFFTANTVFMTFALACFWRLQASSTFLHVAGRIQQAKEQHEQDEATRRAEQARNLESTVVAKGIRRYMSEEMQGVYDRITAAQSKTTLACVSIAYIFVVTLAVFPALTSRVHPKGQDTSKDATLTFVAWHFFVFNLSDLLGRSLPAVAPKLFCIARMRVLAVASASRTILVPLLAMCNVSSFSAAPKEGAKTPFSSLSFFDFLVALGFSNGLLATNIFIAGPRQSSLRSDDERNLTAGLLSWWLTVGLAIGSLASFLA